MRKARKSKKTIGTYNFQGCVDITDPMYNHTVWCRLNHIAIKHGDYNCVIEEKDEGEFGRCVSKIGIYHVGGPSPDPTTIENIGFIGVDSGMAGFFHDKKDLVTDEDFDDFDAAVERKVKGKRPNAWMLYDGFFSSSGFGDGEYDVYAYHDANGEINALEIEFIGDDE